MNKRLLYALAASIMPLMVCSGMVYSVLSIYFSQDLGASTTQIGAVFMIGAAAGALMSPSTGKLSDRVGRRAVLLASMVGFTLAFALYAFINDVVQAALIQLLEGSTWAGMGSAASAYIADVAGEGERGWAMGVYHRVYYLGWIIGPILGGYLADVVGFRNMFLIGSSLIVIGILILLFFVKETRPRS